MKSRWSSSSFTRNQTANKNVCHLSFFKNANVFRFIWSVCIKLSFLKSPTLIIFILGSSSTTVCGTRDALCVRNNSEHFSSKLKTCKCFPNCDFLKYDIKHFKSENQMTTVLVTYDETNFYGYVKRRVFDFEELLASLGGFLGLILGISVLSVIEVVYFMLFQYLKSSDARRRDNLKQNLTKKVFLSYGDFSSIHGINHVCDQSRLLKGNKSLNDSSSQETNISGQFGRLWLQLWWDFAQKQSWVFTCMPRQIQLVL